jgi:hypothetical protein
MNMIKQTVLVVAALTILIAIVASVMLAATAHAQEPITCEGILRQDGDRLFMAAQEGVEGICEFVNPTARWKVQGACRIDRFCRVQGMADDCNDMPTECSEITRVLSAVPLASHPPYRLRAWQR